MLPTWLLPATHALQPPPPAALATPSPQAALVLEGLDAVLRHGKCVEKTVSRTLRAGSRSGVLGCNDQRAAVAEALFGVSMLRARLAHLAAATDLEPDPAALLSLFLTHETPQRVDAAVLARELPCDALGLPDAARRRVRALDVQRDVAWPDEPGARLAVQYSLPPRLVSGWAAELQSWDEAELLAAACNRAGPVTLRANTALGGRAALRDALARDAPAALRQSSDGELSPWAVRLHGGRPSWGGSLWALPCWGEGAFEAQDEGSQCVAAATEAAEGETVLDLCAGNGGKTLALAAMVGPSGRVLAYDVQQSRLQQLGKAAERARVAARVESLPELDERRP